MSELVILCIEQNIYCDSVAYCCNGAVRSDSESYASTSFNGVGYTTTEFSNVAYEEMWALYTYIFTSTPKRLVTSDGKYVILSDSDTHLTVEY